MQAEGYPCHYCLAWAADLALKLLAGRILAGKIKPGPPYFALFAKGGTSRISRERLRVRAVRKGCAPGNYSSRKRPSPFCHLDQSEAPPFVISTKAKLPPLSPQPKRSSLLCHLDQSEVLCRLNQSEAPPFVISTKAKLPPLSSRPKRSVVERSLCG